MPRLIAAALVLGAGASAPAQDPKTDVLRKLAEFDQALIKKDIAWFSTNCDRWYSENLGGRAIARSEALSTMKQWMRQVDVASCRSRMTTFAKVAGGYDVIVETTLAGTYRPGAGRAAPLRSFVRVRQIWGKRGTSLKLRNMRTLSQNTKIDGKTIRP
jgi:hypothetical protein